MVDRDNLLKAVEQIAEGEKDTASAKKLVASRKGIIIVASTKINKAFLNGKVYLAKAYPANEQRNTDGTVVRRA